jgi:hypothetical protein
MVVYREMAKTGPVAPSSCVFDSYMGRFYGPTSVVRCFKDVKLTLKYTLRSAGGQVYALLGIGVPWERKDHEPGK